MAESNINVMLDTVRKNNLITIFAVKNDYGARFITAKITDDGKPKAVKQTATVVINAVRRDKASKSFSGSVNKDGTVKVPVTQWMLDVVGEVECSVAIVSDETRLTTTSFYINAQKSIWDGVGEPSEDNPNHDVILEIIASENVRIANEEARISGEAERVSAEQNRATSEENRKTAESERVTAESARADAEEKRITAEGERASAETARKTAETVRSDKENIRIENENARVANETARKTNETSRVNNENTRKTNETSRIVAENVRLSSEEIRASAEETRKGNETVRVANENVRIQNETARKAEFDTWSSEVGKISAFDKRISNIEAAVMPELVTPTVDKTVAHRKDVPENVLPFASINEIGGMSYKCNNLIPFPYGKDGVDGGDVKLVVGSDGGITGSGTPTSAISFALSDKIELPEGTYTLSTQGTFANMLVQIDVYNANGEVTLSRAIKDSLVFTAEKNGYVTILVKRGANGEAMSGTCYPMLNEGETALPYEPYFTGLRDAKVTAIESVGVNLIPFPYISVSGETNGITWTVKDNGAIIVNGTANKASFFSIARITLPAGRYVMGKVDGEDKKAYGIYAKVGTENHWSGTAFTLAEETLVIINAVAYEGTTVSNLEFYPMLSKGETALPYTPYFKNTIEIPEAVQAIDGYGQGVNEQYHNKIVWDPAEGVKKFVKNCEKRAYESGDESIDNVITDGVSETIYIIDAPIETDISDYLGDDNFIGVESGGTVTAVNEYGYAVPFEVEYMVKGGGTDE